MDFKQDFEIFKNRDIEYLDSGATTQRPKYVLDKISEYYKNSKKLVNRKMAEALGIDLNNEIFANAEIVE